VSLNSRVARLERKTAPGCPTDHELREACQLLDRCFKALYAPAIFGPAWGTEPDPVEVMLMKEAEASGRIAAAREVRRRYSRAHGHRDPSEMSVEDRQKAVLAELDAAFGIDDAESPRSAQNADPN
jgi:hypothetical protein